MNLNPTAPPEDTAETSSMNAPLAGAGAMAARGHDYLKDGKW